MNALYSDLITALRKLNFKIAFVTAGGGAGLFELFKIPGCSHVMSEARMLYSPASFHSFLSEPLTGNYVSQETADRLATSLSSKSEANLCFSLTCALSTARQRLGDDHGYLAICQQGDLVYREHIKLPPTDRSRQDRILTETVLNRVLEITKTNETTL